jgi:hypothetical protein
MRSQLSRVRTLAGFAAGVAAVLFTVVVRNADLLVKVRVQSADPAALPIDICDDAGRVRTFRDVDDFVKAAAKASLFSAAGVSMSFSNLVALEPAPFTGDYVKRAQSQVASYNAQKLRLTATASELSQTLALMPSTTISEQAIKAEKQEQKDAVDAQLGYVNGEITRLQAILAPAGV